MIEINSENIKIVLFPKGKDEEFVVELFKNGRVLFFWNNGFEPIPKLVKKIDGFIIVKKNGIEEHDMFMEIFIKLFIERKFALGWDLEKKDFVTTKKVLDVI